MLKYNVELRFGDNTAGRGIWDSVAHVANAFHGGIIDLSIRNFC